MIAFPEGDPELPDDGLPDEIEQDEEDEEEEDHLAPKGVSSCLAPADVLRMPTEDLE